MRGLTGPIVKGLIFIVVTVLATAVLLSTISSSGVSGSATTYHAIFTDVTSLNVGDDVRMAGVKIGSVASIGVYDKREAEVAFTISSDVHLASTITAAIRYRNLVGQRYIELDQGDGAPDSRWPSDRTLPLSRTSPALDLTTLFNGFQPLFSALDPKQVNELSYEIIQVFQGEGSTINDLLLRTATLTSTLADRDHLIGQVVNNLNSVLTTVNARRTGLSTTVTTLQQLVGALSQDRGAIGSAVTNLAGLTHSVSGLLAGARQPLKGSIDNLGRVSRILADNGGTVGRFLKTLPVKLDRIGRLVSYGSWVNAYLCSIGGRIPVPAGYYGGVGAQPVAARCSA
jgi:phospholipid/cholesterol/gamma-HCH transport system substrate-binding protein